MDIVLDAYEAWQRARAHYKAPEPNITVAYASGVIYDNARLRGLPIGAWFSRANITTAVRSALGRLHTAGMVARSVGLGARGEALVFEPGPKARRLSP
jgi:hypothetical protein